MLGDVSCNLQWECKNQSQVERNNGFELKILFGSSWSAPTELRPQTGVSCMSSRAPETCQCIRMCWVILSVEHRGRLSVVLVYFQIVPLGTQLVHMLSFLQHTWPLRYLIYLTAVCPEPLFTSRPRLQETESYLVLTLLLNYVAKYVSMGSAAKIYAQEKLLGCGER